MILVGLVLFAGIVSYQYFHSVQRDYAAVTSFKECVDSGFKVLAVYPEKCVMSGKSFTNPLQKESIPIISTTNTTQSNNFKNLSYRINEQSILLVDGESTSTHLGVSNEAVKFIITGQPFLYDINEDTKEDVIFLLKMTGDKSRKDVYYLSTALALNTGYLGTNALYVDVSILSSTFVYKNGEIVLSYTTKEATTTTKEKVFLLNNGILKQISRK